MPKELNPHIGIYGRRNNGKSSLINRLASQEISIVSDFAGTTTDIVKKSIEITGVGPVVLIDTAGVDDTGELGLKRVNKTVNSIKTIDLAIIVLCDNKFEIYEDKIIHELDRYQVPYFFLVNKVDTYKVDEYFIAKLQTYKVPIVQFSNITSKSINPIVDTIKETIPESAYTKTSLLGGLVNYGDIILLITPIDIEAPEGRIILPQVQTIRDALDNDCTTIVLKEREVDSFLKKTGIKPDLAITDSQIFLKADASIPKDIPLTGFSVLLARYKGDFDLYLKGTPEIDNLKNGDKILILESCTHHVACDDIGRVKIPRWISNYTGKEIDFDIVTGLSKIPDNLSQYKLAVQCGGCVLTRKQVINRVRAIAEAGVPVTNYGMAIAWVQGIYKRAIEPFTGEKENIDYL